MNRKYIWPTVKYFCKKINDAFISFGICICAILGFAALWGTSKLFFWTLLVLTVALAVLDTVIAVKNTLRENRLSGQAKEAAKNQYSLFDRGEEP